MNLSPILWNNLNTQAKKDGWSVPRQPNELTYIADHCPFQFRLNIGRTWYSQSNHTRLIQLINPDDYLVSFDKVFKMWNRGTEDVTRDYEFTFNIDEEYTYDEDLYNQGILIQTKELAAKIPHIWVYYLTDNYLWDMVSISQQIEYISL